jgi:hypothetical protein
MDEPDRRIRTDANISSYAGYMPDDWGEKTIDPIPDGTVLERLLMDLALSWRSASYTAQMPATCIRAMHAAALGRTRFISPDSSILAYSESIIAELARRTPGLVGDGELCATLLSELVKISAEVRDRTAAVKNEYPIEPLWAEFMEEVGFRISLWESQRIAFVAFYNAYESFIVRSLKVATGNRQLRSSQKKPFNEALRSGLGKDISPTCWSHHDINIARLVRHALSHYGGRETEDLKKQKHGVSLIDEELQIQPEDVKRMLQCLRTAVDEVTAIVRGNPKFMATAPKTTAMSVN